MLTITLLGTAATMPLPDRALSVSLNVEYIDGTKIESTACCGTAARARRQRHTGQA